MTRSDRPALPGEEPRGALPVGARHCLRPRGAGGRRRARPRCRLRRRGRRVLAPAGRPGARRRRRRRRVVRGRADRARRSGQPRLSAADLQARRTCTIARFGPDGRTLVYAARWEGATAGAVLSAARQPGVQGDRPAGGSPGRVEARRDGGAANQPGGEHGAGAACPIGGGAPREVLEKGAVRRLGTGSATRWRSSIRSTAVTGSSSRSAPAVQRQGWLSDLAVSPTGDRLAFAEHPVAIDNRGDVAVIDLKGKRTAISAGWEDIFGVHWGARRRRNLVQRVRRRWKGAGHGSRDVRGDAGGEGRTVMSAPGSLDVEDIAPDGRVLLAHGAGGRRSWCSRLAGEGRDRADVDGLLVGQRYLRRRPPGSSSPSRAWAGEPGMRCISGAPINRRRCVSARASRNICRRTGAGRSPSTLMQNRLVDSADRSRRTANRSSVGHQGLLVRGLVPRRPAHSFSGLRGGKAFRMYMQDLKGGAPRRGDARRRGRPIGHPVAGRQVGCGGAEGPAGAISGRRRRPAADPGRRASGHADPMARRRPSALREERPAPGADLLDRRRDGPAHAHPRDPPRDTVGVGGIGDIRLTPDGKSYAYVYIRSLYSLYQVTGLK